MSLRRELLAAGIIAASTGLAFSPAGASITFSEWDASSLSTQLEQAGRARQLVLVVVTQPDWCPPCIRLDRDVLGNPDEVVLSSAAGDWLAVEIYGYDAPGAALLAQHALRFQGTPTTYLLAPEPGNRRLGDATVLTSVVGYPKDYVDQLTAAAAGQDPVAEVSATAEQSGQPEDLLALARLHAARGDTESARKVYDKLHTLDHATIPGVGADSLAAVCHQAGWELISEVQARVDKDHQGAVAALDVWALEYPDEAFTEEFVWARAWSLAQTGDVQAALDAMEHTFLEPGTVSGVRSFLYFAFRNPHQELLERAEHEARQALAAHPDSEGPLEAGLGRILRRQGRIEEAEASFARAVELTDPESSAYPIYLAQLEYVRAEQH